MFAMRACRRSVMIGKSLTKTQMVAVGVSNARVTDLRSFCGTWARLTSHG